MHTHFGSATHLLGATLEILISFTFLRIAAYHLRGSKNKLIAGLGGALFIQTG